MTKNFKTVYSDEENRNNTTYGGLQKSMDFVQNDPYNMDSFLNLEDTFIESKKNYGGKMGSTVIVGKKEKHLEINWLNYRTAHIEPTQSNDYLYSVGLSSDTNGKQTARYVDLLEAEPNNYRKCIIQQDGMYRLMHKEELNLDATDREVYTYINRKRTVDGAETNVPICVYHIQGNVSKTLSGTTSGTDPSGTCSVTLSLTLGEMHPRITGFSTLYSFLKKGDILEYMIIGNKKDLVEANRVDISSQVRDYSNIWQVEFVSWTFDELSSKIKKYLPVTTS